MTSLLKGFTDHGDRLESIVPALGQMVTVSIDKPDINVQTTSTVLRLMEDIETVLQSSLDYFNHNKGRYLVGYIDDLKRPQIMVNQFGYAVYWCSKKGEQNGECVVGVDFHADTDAAFQLTIGD